LLVLSLGICFVLLTKVLLVLWLNPVIGWYPQLPPLTDIMQASVRNNLLVCIFVIGLAHALLYAENARHRELRIAELQTRLSQARLETLSTQLNPHFLFNTLNSIAELVHHDAEASDRMLVGLSALLRRSLDRSQEQEVRLSDELALLAHYLDIQKIRLGARLRIVQTIDATALDARVPALILQPIAENAIVHAIARRIEGGELRICAKRDHDRLILEIANDGDARIAADKQTYKQTDKQTDSETVSGSAVGAGSHAASNAGTGVGLRNTRERLACLYGDASRLELLRDDDGGTRARIELPFSRHTGNASMTRAMGATA
jgi:LytS/YehU family sensor histidine kinase